MTNEKDIAKSIASKLIEHGFTALLVGGCVRDSLLGKTPKDYDIATSATPEQVLEIFPDADKVGAHFGVVIVKQDGGCIEVATFRSDSAYSDGRRPDEVTFSTCPSEDAERRDFTFNGLFEGVVSGHIYDYHGGLNDLDNKRVRCIGNADERFGEDALRLLRAVRFATVLGFDIEEDTWLALKSNAPNIDQVSRERVKDELVKILNHENRFQGWCLLVESGLASRIFPYHTDLRSVGRLIDRVDHSDFNMSVFLCLFGITFACVSIETVDVKRLEQDFRYLKFENDTIKESINSIKDLPSVYKFDIIQDCEARKLLASKHFTTFKTVAKVLAGGFIPFKDLLRREKQFGHTLPKPLITGDDLIGRGHTPSPRFGVVLGKAFDDQLNGLEVSLDKVCEDLSK